VIKCADYVIDLGPEGGPGGGQIIASGTVEEVAREDQSPTGQFLRKILSSHHAI
jgi:excinuclease ABC subunit A